MDAHVDRVLIDRATIHRRVGELGERIAADLAADLRQGASDGPPELTIVPILTGSLIFVADLVRRLPVMIRLRMISVSSYPGTATTSRGPRLTGDLPDDLADAHVLLVDDIFDSGRTLDLALGMLRERRPASLRSCVLLSKDVPRATSARPDYVGFDVPDRFVVGYGLDYDGYYRNLPEVVTLRPEVMS